MRKSSAARSTVQKTPRKPLPPKIAALLRESWWLLLIGAALYLVLILATYSKSDPGWSHQASGSQVVNAGGKAGAWLADVALYVFGLSAWWWVLLLIGGVVWGYLFTGVTPPDALLNQIGNSNNPFAPNLVALVD